MTGPLSLPPEDMRRLGYRVVDRIVEHLEQPRRAAAGAHRRRRSAARAPRRAAAGAAGRSRRRARRAVRRGAAVHPARRPPALLRAHRQPEQLRRRARRRGSPRASTSFTGSWTGGSGPATRRARRARLAARAVRAARRRRGGAHHAAARSPTSPGSPPRARPRPGRRVLLGPDARGRAAGAARARSRGRGCCESDARFRLDPRELRAAIAADRAAGRRPVCVVATAGTTSTGSVDPLDALADLCAEEDLWLHVDGAYGGAGRPVPGARPLLAGLERADSLVLDPHKWLFQPYEIGCLLVREPGAARAHVRARGRLPARRADRRGQLPQPLGAAHARGARAEAVAVDPGLRDGGVPRGGRPRDRAGRARRGAVASARRAGRS